ncbi:MAG: hypothetical protein QF561_05005 [Phycisphaerales bacterium]|jgi:hypothetical protein|nr:hypothetical protein [Phycisphaerales bacterium]
MNRSRSRSAEQAQATANRWVQAHDTRDHPEHAIGLLALLAVTSSVAMTICNPPGFGTTGFAIVFCLLAPGNLGFVPAALVSAEVAICERGWPGANASSRARAAFGQR